MTGAGRIRACVIAAVAIGAAAALVLRADAQEAPPTTPAATAPTTELSPDDVIRADVHRQKAILLSTDPRTPIDQREQAAERLLSYNLPDTSTILVRAISTPAGPGAADARDAVARAIAASSLPPDSQFLEPLRTMLSSDPAAAAAPNRYATTPQSTAAAVAALTRYATTPQSTDALNILISLARDPRAAGKARALAAGGLGAFGQRTSAATLMEILRAGPAELEDVRNSAADALANLTGLNQNGHDLGKWEAWWQTASNRPENQWIDSAPLAARGNQLDRKNNELSDRIERWLPDVYQQAADPQKENLLLSWMRDAEPSFRNAAVNIVITQTSLGRGVTDAVREQLRSLIADISPDVRKNVTIALRDTGDLGSLPVILTQLSREKDPDVKVAMATALGKFHKLAGVEALLSLLDDPNTRVQTFAADALKDRDMVAEIRKDPRVFAKVSTKLRVMLQNPSNQTVRASLLGAAGPLGDPEMLQDFRAALDPNNAEPVRIAGARGLGYMIGPSERVVATQLLMQAMGDQHSRALRLNAVQAVQKVGTFERVREALYDRLQPRNETDPTVIAEAWSAFIALAKADDVKGESLIPLVDRYARDNHAKRIELLELAVKKLQDNLNDILDPARKLDVVKQLAQQQENIGGEYEALGNAWDKAARHYEASLTLWKSPNMQPARATIASLSENLERCYLRGGSYKMAIQFAGERMAAGGEEEETMGVAIRDQVRALTAARKYKEAIELLDEAMKLQPPFHKFWTDYLKQARDESERQAAQSAPGNNGQ